jgi:hypothetical protein
MTHTGLYADVCRVIDSVAQSLNVVRWKQHVPAENQTTILLRKKMIARYSRWKDQSVIGLSTGFHFVSDAAVCRFFAIISFST